MQSENHLQPMTSVSRDYWMPGAVLVVAAVVMVTGAAVGFLAPSLREAPPFVTEDVAAAAAAIVGNPTAWQWANGLILAAAVLTTLALVALTHHFRGESSLWALLGLVTFAVAAVLETVDRLIAMGITTWAAERYPDPTAFSVWEAFDRLRLGSVFLILGFGSVALYGMAFQRARRTGVGWSFVGIGLIGILLELVGAAIPAYVYFSTAALGVATWRLEPNEPQTGHQANLTTQSGIIPAEGSQGVGVAYTQRVRARAERPSLS